MKLLIMIFLLSANCMAAQCENVSVTTATKALNFLKKLDSSQEIFIVDEYCEACLDYIPKPILVNSIKLIKDKRTNRASIEINKNKVDMAYIYVDGDNLAKMIGCHTYAVSNSIY